MTQEEREARLAEEEAAARLEKESQLDIDRMASDENREMERIFSQAGTRGVEEPYRVAAARAAKDLRDDEKEMDLMEQAYLLSMMESMRGEDIGQAPAVVAGGGQRRWPSMMGQFAPWEQQKPYWWIT
jgi:tRNA U34 5-carboxymethylaminomethyl modifying enzyme MnmG/GidA